MDLDHLESLLNAVNASSEPSIKSLTQYCLLNSGYNPSNPPGSQPSSAQQIFKHLQKLFQQSGAIQIKFGVFIVISRLIDYSARSNGQPYLRLFGKSLRLYVSSLAQSLESMRHLMEFRAIFERWSSQAVFSTTFMSKLMDFAKPAFERLARLQQMEALSGSMNNNSNSNSNSYNSGSHTSNGLLPAGTNITNPILVSNPITSQNEVPVKKYTKTFLMQLQHIKSISVTEQCYEHYCADRAVVTKINQLNEEYKKLGDTNSSYNNNTNLPNPNNPLNPNNPPTLTNPLQSKSKLLQQYSQCKQQLIHLIKGYHKDFAALRKTCQAQLDLLGFDNVGGGFGQGN